MKYYFPGHNQGKKESPLTSCRSQSPQQICPGLAAASLPGSSWRGAVVGLSSALSPGGWAPHGLGSCSVSPRPQNPWGLGEWFSASRHSRAAGGPCSV